MGVGFQVLAFNHVTQSPTCDIVVSNRLVIKADGVPSALDA